MLHHAFRRAAVVEALGTPRNLTVSQDPKVPLAYAFYAAFMTLPRFPAPWNTGRRGLLPLES